MAYGMKSPGPLWEAARRDEERAQKRAEDFESAERAAAVVATALGMSVVAELVAWFELWSEGPTLAQLAGEMRDEGAKDDGELEEVLEVLLVDLLELGLVEFIRTSSGRSGAEVSAERWKATAKGEEFARAAA